MPRNSCKPCLKWAGGKRQIASILETHLPTSYNRYFEPFLGGGALFFKHQPKEAFLSDTNADLIRVYTCIHNHADQLIKSLKTHKNTKEYYYEIRKQDRHPNFSTIPDLEKASRFLYLNKTCYNGLYRVNANGQFNTPFGYYKKPNIVQEETLKTCQKALKNAHLSVKHFTDIEIMVGKNDFVYLDPPYVPISKTANFTHYTKEGFNEIDQINLKNLCDTIHKKGGFFMCSNSYTPFILKTYKSYNILEIEVPRFINSNGNGRGPIKEVIIKNYD